VARPIDQHIDSKELNALVPSVPATEPNTPHLHPDIVRQAERHVQVCLECSRRVAKYREMMDRLSSAVVPAAAPRRAGCPQDQDVDWQEVADGMWPELKAKQLIMHAARCEHCGPLLRAASSAEATPDEEQLLAQLKAPSQPRSTRSPGSVWRVREASAWLVPAAALIAFVGILITRPSLSPPKVAASTFTEFAVNVHRQHAGGNLPLEVCSDSMQTVNQWLQARSQFSIALPDSPALPGDERPYQLEGARFVQLGNTRAAYIAYRVQSGPVSMIVTPDSVTVASGGVEASFPKVTFHYAMVEQHRVVTWTAHGLTYALVSQEGSHSQQSCMVCHSALRDRDLSRTPTPLNQQGAQVRPLWQ